MSAVCLHSVQVAPPAQVQEHKEDEASVRYAIDALFNSSNVAKDIRIFVIFTVELNYPSIFGNMSGI